MSPKQKQKAIDPAGRPGGRVVCVMSSLSNILVINDSDMHTESKWVLKNAFIANIVYFIVSALLGYRVNKLSYPIMQVI